MKRNIGFGILVWLATSTVALAQTDTVTLTSGETITGQIKTVENGVLTIATAYSSADFQIKWDQVASLSSARPFVIETVDGRRVPGSLTADVANKALQVGGVSVALAEISAIEPPVGSFWTRFESSIDVGYSMTRANDARQLTAGAKVLYTHDRVVDTIVGNVFSNSQSNAPDTQRWNLGNDFRYMVGDRWYANSAQDLLGSDEQSLDLRTTIGGGAGRYLFRSASQYLTASGGVAWTREDYTDSQIPTQDSGEAYVGTEFMTEELKLFNLVTRFNFYPSLTIDDRYRINYTLDIDFNLPGNWYVRTSLFENYDSSPPADLSKNDWGWSNAVGFKF